MKPIRIIQINKLFFPWIGGIETVVRQLTEGLAKDADFKVSVLAGNEEKGIKNKNYTWKNANIYKAASFGIKFSTPLSISYPFLLKKVIKENDVFHFHAPNPLGELSFFLNPIPAHKKVIVTVHADVQQTRWKFFAPVYNFFFKRLLKRADVITTMGPQNIESFKSLHPFKDKCVVVPLAYDETHDCIVNENDKATFREKFNLDKTKKTIIFVGRLSYYKGISQLLKAVANLKDTQLIIVGDGQLKEEIIKEVNELKISDRVILTGFLKGLPLACAYSVADVFTLPSTTESETFGIVQAEAMKFALPVVNTSLPTAVPSVSLNGISGLTVKPGDYKELEDAIERIIYDDSLRAMFSKKAYERSFLFSPEIMVSNFKKVYV